MAIPNGYPQIWDPKKNNPSFHHPAMSCGGRLEILLPYQIPKTHLVTSLLPNTGLETTSCLFFEAAPCTVAPLRLTVEWSRPRWVRSGPTTRNLDCFWSWEQPPSGKGRIFPNGTGFPCLFSSYFFNGFFLVPFFSQCTGLGSGWHVFVVWSFLRI